MKEVEAKYHHLVPKTYLSAWANTSGTLKIEYLNNPGEIVSRNKEKIAGITDYHSIQAGMPICTKSDTDTIFSILSDYNVELNGKIINNSMDLNRYYYDFDNWIIKRKDGSLVGKKYIKREIEKTKIKDIESNWGNKYENYWNSAVEEIEAKILNEKAECIPSFNKEYLMKFFVAINWRGFQSNKQFEEVLQNITKDTLDKIIIPFRERELPCLETAADEIRHEILLKYFRQYLDDKGVIYDYAIASLKNTGFHFLISDGPTHFNTSDSPSFVFQRADGAYQGIMPITPQILLAQGKCTDCPDMYYITHITDDDVRSYNQTITNNAVSFIIHA